MNTTTSRAARGRTATILGPVLAIAVAWSTAEVKGDVSIANSALALALICVVAALISAVAGFVTSAVAALALNYFHTTPVHSLRMTEPSEIVTVVLLVLLGAAVSIATTLRVRARVTSYRAGESEAAARELREMLHQGAALPAVWQLAIQAACQQAGSIDVSLVAAAPGSMPVINQKPASGPADDRDAVLLPEAGAVLELDSGQGALVLTPQAGLGAIMTKRTVLLQFGRQVGEILSNDPTSPAT